MVSTVYVTVLFYMHMYAITQLVMSSMRYIEMLHFITVVVSYQLLYCSPQVTSKHSKDLEYLSFWLANTHRLCVLMKQFSNQTVSYAEKRPFSSPCMPQHTVLCLLYVPLHCSYGVCACMARTHL